MPVGISLTWTHCSSYQEVFVVPYIFPLNTTSLSSDPSSVVSCLLKIREVRDSNDLTPQGYPTSTLYMGSDALGLLLSVARINEMRTTGGNDPLYTRPNEFDWLFPIFLRVRRLVAFLCEVGVVVVNATTREYRETSCGVVGDLAGGGAGSVLKYQNV